MATVTASNFSPMDMLNAQATAGLDDEYYTPRRMAWAELDSLQNEYGTNACHLDIPVNKTPNLITSLIEGEDIHPSSSVMNHAPVIDIDVPCELVPSSQLGHYHLYIHKPMTWSQFHGILLALSTAEVVEPGYFQACTQRMYSSVRPVGTFKPGLKERVKHVLRDMAVTKTRNHILTNRLRVALQKIEALEASATCHNSTRDVNTIQ
jgi:hypothetical protein